MFYYYAISNKCTHLLHIFDLASSLVFHAIVQKIHLHLLDYFMLKCINFLLNLSSEFYVTCAYIFILHFALEISYFCGVQVLL